MRKTQSRPVAKDSYFALVREFPLRTIKTEAQHAAAREFLISISLECQETKDRGVLDFMETLAALIENYEKDHGYGLDLSGLTPISAINHLMEVHGLNVTQMAQIMGTSQGTLSEIRQGKRGVSKEMIRKLVDRFGVDARIFI
jgi:antitoxin component HigA of HigAB toxin-antitoxin module